METQLQKFNGKNVCNNRVHINFKKKKVEFDPIKKGGFWFYYLRYLFTCLSYWAFRVSIIYIALACIIYVIDDTSPIIGVISLIAIILLLSLSFISSTAYLNKNWRENKYPQDNHNKLSNVVFKRLDEECEVNPKAVINKIFILPYFSNVCLEYELSGDFSRYIKDIKIENIYKNNDQEWLCVFIFTKQPLKGNMKLRYL